MLSEIAKIIGQFPNSLLAIIITNIILIFGFIFGKLLLYRFENRCKIPFTFYGFYQRDDGRVFYLDYLVFVEQSLQRKRCLCGDVPDFSVFAVIIGHFASYEKIQYYTNVQVLTLVISLLLAFSFI